MPDVITLGKIFTVRRGWCIRIYEFFNRRGVLHSTLTHLAPGRLIGDITLEHNSVGACVGGSITFDGFLNWPPRTRVIEVFDGPDAVLSNRLGLVLNGVLTSTRPVNGSRVTTVPLLGLHTRDENGLAALGFSSVGQFVDAGIYILGSYLNVSNTPRRFGLTNDAAMKELFGDRVDSSWGVRPDGIRVAGYGGASGTIAIKNTDANGNETWGTSYLSLGPLVLDANTLGNTYEDSGYEEPAFITEVQWRMSERYSTNTFIRPDNGLVPRRGSSAETGTGELVPTTTPVAAAPADVSGTMGGMSGGVDIVSIINGSIKNPNAFNPMYETLSIAIEVTVTATFASGEEDVFAVPGGDPIRKPAEQFAYIEWAEWLGPSAAKPKIQPRTTNLPSIQVESQSPADWTKVATSTPVKNSQGVVTDLNETVIKPLITVYASPGPYTDQETVVDDESAFRGLYHQFATLTPARPKFVWRFEVPGALLQIVDGAAPTVSYEAEVDVVTYQNGVPVTTKEKKTIVTAAYQWCYGVAASATRKSTVLNITATPVMHYHNAVHPPGMPDFPGINLPFSSPPTFQGVYDGALFYGPAIMQNLHSASGQIYTQPTTNTRMIIGTNTRKTEWQSGAAQRSSNGTAANVSNDRTFALRDTE